MLIVHVSKVEPTPFARAAPVARLDPLAGQRYAQSMVSPSVIGEVLKAFQIAINSHDRENPTHTAHGIGMAHFNMDRLGFEEGEEVLPGIIISADGGPSGNFRVLCDGDHDKAEEAEEVETVEAVSRDLVPVRVGGSGDDRGDERTFDAN